MSKFIEVFEFTSGQRILINEIGISTIVPCKIGCRILVVAGDREIEFHVSNSYEDVKKFLTSS